MKKITIALAATALAVCSVSGFAAERKIHYAGILKSPAAIKKLAKMGIAKPVSGQFSLKVYKIMTKKTRKPKFYAVMNGKADAAFLLADNVKAAVVDGKMVKRKRRHKKK